MNFQKQTADISREKAVQLLSDEVDGDCQIDNLEYWAWPTVFGSTTGPFAGVGGQAMSTFTLEAWHDTWTGKAVIFCQGKILRVVERFEPMTQDGKYKE